MATIDARTETAQNIDAYRAVVSSAVIETPDKELGWVLQASLCNVLVLRNPGIGTIDVEWEGSLEKGCRAFAESVLTNPSQSSFARDVLEGGLSAPVLTHFRLVNPGIQDLK